LASFSEIGESLQELYRQFGHPLDVFNGPDGAQHLPVPATFLIDGKGVIRLARVDVDYARRLDPDDVITALTKLMELPSNDSMVRTRQNGNP
jgi:hypothetical protein